MDRIADARWDGELLEVARELRYTGFSAAWRGLVVWLVDFGAIEAWESSQVVGLRGCSSGRWFWHITVDADGAAYYASDLRDRLAALGPEGLLRDLGAIPQDTWVMPPR